MAENPPPGPVTIRDLARACQLSVSAVSKALNRPAGKNGVNPQTKLRVIEVARSMNYQPNWQAKSLKSNRTHAIAFVFFCAATRIPNTTGAHEDIIRNLEELFHGEGYHTFFVALNRTAEEYNKIIHSHRADAYILFSFGPEEFIRKANSLGQPVVVVNGRAEGGEALSLAYDDRQGAGDAAKYLLSLGHRDIGYYDGVKPGSSNHYSFVERTEGMRGIMDAAGLGDRLQVFTHMSVMDMLDRFPGQGRPPTAVLFYNHIRAVECQRYCWEKKIGIPDDLSLMTFNDSFPLARLTPAMSAISLPAAPVIEMAFDRLMGALRRGERSIDGFASLREELVIRESTAPPRVRENAGAGD